MDKEERKFSNAIKFATRFLLSGVLCYFYASVITNGVISSIFLIGSLISLCSSIENLLIYLYLSSKK